MAGKASGPRKPKGEAGANKSKKTPKPKGEGKTGKTGAKGSAKPTGGKARSGRRDDTKRALIAIELVQPDQREQERGRPPEFRVEYCFLAKKLALLGATLEEMADFFEKDVSTLKRWLVEHPEFKDAIKDGGRLADMNVAESVYRKACGYVYEEEFVKGVGEERVILKRNVTVEPDFQAARFWLMNRDRARWAERKDVNLSFNHEAAMQELAAAAGA